MLVLFAVLSVVLVFDPRLWPTDPIADLSAPWVMPQHGTMLESENRSQPGGSILLALDTEAHSKQYRLLSARHGAPTIYANGLVRRPAQSTLRSSTSKI